MVGKDVVSRSVASSCNAFHSSSDTYKRVSAALPLVSAYIPLQIPCERERGQFRWHEICTGSEHVLSLGHGAKLLSSVQIPHDAGFPVPSYDIPLHAQCARTHERERERERERGEGEESKVCAPFVCARACVANWCHWAEGSVAYCRTRHCTSAVLYSGCATRTNFPVYPPIFGTWK